MDKDIPAGTFNLICARFERIIKRLWILVIILTFLLVGTNCAWLYYESQFETIESTTETYTSDATDGGVAIANGDGEVDYNG